MRKLTYNNINRWPLFHLQPHDVFIKLLFYFPIIFIYIYLVYVFLGENRQLNEFMTTMEMMRLFDKGEYVVISVDWETYTPERALAFLWSWVVISQHFAQIHQAVFILIIISLHITQETKFYASIKTVKMHSRRHSRLHNLYLWS